MFHKIGQLFTEKIKHFFYILSNPLTLKPAPSYDTRMTAELILQNRKKDKTLLFVILGYVAFLLFAIVTGEISTSFTLTDLFSKIVGLIIFFYLLWWIVIPVELFSFIFFKEDLITQIFKDFFGNYEIIISDSFFYYFEAMSFFAVALRFITALVYFIRYSATYTTTFYKLIPFLIFSIFILSLAALKTFFILNIEGIPFTPWVLLQAISIMLFGALHSVFSVFQNADEDLALLNRVLGLNHIALLIFFFGSLIALSGGTFYLVVTQDFTLTLEPSLFFWINALIYSITFFLMIKYFYESLRVIKYADDLLLNILSMAALTEMIVLFGLLVITPITGDYAIDFLLKIILLPLFPTFALLYKNSISFGVFSIIAAYIVFIIIPVFSPMITEIIQVLPGMYDHIINELDWLFHPSWWTLFITAIISFVIIGVMTIVGIGLLIGYFLLQVSLSILSATSGDIWNIFLLFLQGILSFIAFFIAAIVVSVIIIKTVEYLQKKNLLTNLLIIFTVATLGAFSTLAYTNVDTVALQKSNDMQKNVYGIKKKLDRMLHPERAKLIEDLVSKVKYNTREYEDDMDEIRKNYLTMPEAMQKKMFEVTKEDLKAQEKKEIQRVCNSPKYIQEGIKKLQRMSYESEPLEYSKEDIDEITVLCSEQVQIKTDIEIGEMKSKIYKDLNTTLKDLKAKLKRQELRAQRDQWYMIKAFPYKTKLAIELIEAKIFTPNKEYEKRVKKMHAQVKKALPKYYKIYFSDARKNKKNLKELQKVYKKYQ